MQGLFGGSGKLDDLISQVENARMTQQNDATLMQALATLYLAKELDQLRSSLERVTAASDAIPGGYAIKTIVVR